MFVVTIAFATLNVAVCGLAGTLFSMKLSLKGSLRLVFTMLLLVLNMLITVRNIGGLYRGSRDGGTTTWGRVRITVGEGRGSRGPLGGQILKLFCIEVVGGEDRGKT